MPSPNRVEPGGMQEGFVTSAEPYARIAYERLGHGLALVPVPPASAPANRRCAGAGGHGARRETMRLRQS
jgi:hypothetical protein